MMHGRRLFWLLLLAVGATLGWRWLVAHPEHNVFAPFSFNHPVGSATAGKLSALVSTPAACSAILRAGGIGFATQPPQGSGACRLNDRTQIAAAAMALRPNQPNSTCAVAAGLILWQRRIVAPAAERHLKHRVVGFDHIGTTNCRPIAGRQTMSEHATGNAIDIAAFRLAGGRRITLIRGWQGTADEQAFLRAVRDGACDIFGTTLSPDYNAAHRDHFHFDMAAREFGSVCR